jgi:CTP:molybdopterin cytidylyltransferase MocA
VLILIPAAGSSSRMRGGDKLLEQVGGVPLLRRQAIMAAALAPVLVTLPPGRPARAAALKGTGLLMRILPDAAEGMAVSLRAGARAAQGRALMVLPADMPDIDATDLATLIAEAAARPDAILRGTGADGTPGHPVVFPPDLLPELATLQGDEGARAVLRRHAPRIHPVPLPGRHALTDLDTPEDWAAWRTANPGLSLP